jgi:arabinogalactan endo-1,4-beta-galactosidase
VGCWVDLDMIKYIFIGLLILSSFTKSNQFINGVDISMLKQVEENG